VPRTFIWDVKSPLFVFVFEKIECFESFETLSALE